MAERRQREAEKSLRGPEPSYTRQEYLDDFGLNV